MIFLPRDRFQFCFLFHYRFQFDKTQILIPNGLINISEHICPLLLCKTCRASKKGKIPITIMLIFNCKPHL